MSRVETIGDCTLVLGDSRDWLANVPPCFRVDTVVTDPPYGVDLGKHLASKDRRTDRVLVKDGYDSYDDTPENFRTIIAPTIAASIQISERALVFAAAHMAWTLPAPDALGGIYLPAGCGRNKWGFASLAHALLYGRAPNLQLGAKATAFSSSESAEINGHPCPKPIGWMKWAVSLASSPGDTILDPFMGSGTTGVACVNLGRKFIGIEIEPKYFDIACRRIEEAYKQPRLFAEPQAKPKQEEFIL